MSGSPTPPGCPGGRRCEVAHAGPCSRSKTLQVDPVRSPREGPGRDDGLLGTVDHGHRTLPIHICKHTRRFSFEPNRLNAIGFNFDTPAEVDAWHRRGVGAGGTACEDPPGIREASFGKLYLAYLRDPDGNKLCGLHRPEQ